MICQCGEKLKNTNDYYSIGVCAELYECDKCKSEYYVEWFNGEIELIQKDGKTIYNRSQR